MKLRSTLILLVLCLGLGAYLYFVERVTPTTREASEGRVVDLEREKVDSISLRGPEAKVELRKKDNKWLMEEPAKDRADANAISELLSAVVDLHSDAEIVIDPKNKEQLKEYGVADSNTRLKLVVGGKPLELIIGKDAAIEGKTYIYEEGAKKVHAVSNTLKTQLSKKADDFRDRQLADVPATQVVKVALQSPAGVLELEKKNGHWSLLKPLQARGDDAKINDLVSRALAAHVEDFVPESAAGTSGLSEPKGTLTFTVEGQEKPVVLTLGANPADEKDKNKVYARLSTRDTTVLLPKTVEATLETKPNDLRDKNLLRVVNDLVDRVTLEPAGAGKFVIGRKGESWVRKDGGQDAPINAAIPLRLLDDLQSTQVSEFVSDVATDLPKYGLDKPVLKVTLSSYASENTSETKAGEQPLETVLFGKSENGKAYVKLESEPFIVAVPQAVVDGFPRSAIQLQDLTIFNDKPEEITAVEINIPTQGIVTLEKDKDNKWKLSKGDGEVDQAGVQGLANLLSSLRAVKWIGPAAPEHGLDKPNAVITATLTQGDKKVTRKLTFGAPIESMWFVSADGREGVFQLSQPDFDVLTKPLTSRLAPPPAAPGAAATPTALPRGLGAPAPGMPPGALTPGSIAKPLPPPATPAAR